MNMMKYPHDQLLTTRPKTLGLLHSLSKISDADSRPKEVVYNPAIPIEEFDFVVTDECHRGIYNLWRQVLEHFDASLIGLTATPSKQTIGFFNGHLA